MFARAQVQISFRRRESDPAQSLVFDHGLVVPLPFARRPLSCPASVPFFLVAALTPQSIGRHGQVTAAVVYGHQPFPPAAAANQARVAATRTLPFLKSLLRMKDELAS